MGHLDQLYQVYKGRARFLFIYIREAHPLSVSDTEAGQAREDSAEKQGQRVRRFAKLHGVDFPWLLDAEDGRVERAYDASPRRLVLVGVDGRVAYDTGRGIASLPPHPLPPQRPSQRVAYDTGRGIASPWDFEEIQRQLATCLEETPPVSSPPTGTRPPESAAAPQERSPQQPPHWAGAATVAYTWSREFVLPPHPDRDTLPRQGAV